MPITYTNRKGSTFYLCQGATKTGKTRYYFARQPKGDTVENIPDGYVIRESVNGVVSLAKSQRELMEPREVAVVEQAVRRHPQARNCRVKVKRNMIEVYERVGPGADDLTRVFDEMGLGAGCVSGQRARWSNLAGSHQCCALSCGTRRSADSRLSGWATPAEVAGWTFTPRGISSR